MQLTILDVQSNGEGRGERVSATCAELSGETVEVIWYRGEESKALLTDRLTAAAQRRIDENAAKQAALNELIG